MKYLKNPFARPWGALNLLWAVAAWIATVGNLALWRELLRLHLMHKPADWLFALGFSGMILSVIVLFTAWLALRPLIRPVLSFLLLLTAFVTYYMWEYGVVLDPTMVVNVLHTNADEAGDQLSWKLLLFVLFIAGLPMVWLWRQPLAAAQGIFKTVAKNVGATALAALLFVACLFSVYQPFASLMRNATQVRYMINPLNTLWSTGVVVARAFQKPKVLQPIGLDAKWVGDPHAAKPKILVMVVGETARAANFQLNGYARATNPLLSQRKDIVSFTQVASCGTNTAVSVPCMFGPEGRKNYSPSLYQESLQDVLQRAGLAVLWIDNQAGCKGVCERVPTVSTAEAKDPRFCHDGECLDAIMVDRLDAELAKLSPERRARGVVIFLHQMGSHGPAYTKRSPPAQKLFQPECTSVTLPDCPRQNIINAYDNSIVYTDFMLNQLIGWLQSKEPAAETAMLYVSDHGESLGENHLYLHGLPYAIAPDEQKHPPWIAWFSPDFGEDVGCLRARKDLPMSHDNVFHTILGMMQVQTSIYQPERDAYKPCRH